MTLRIDEGKAAEKPVQPQDNLAPAEGEPVDEIPVETGQAIDLNPLLSSPKQLEDPFSIQAGDQGDIQVAGMAGAFSKAIKKSAADAAVPAYEVTEKAALATDEFLERNKLDVELPDKAININFDYLDAPDKINQTILDTAEVFKEQMQQSRRGKQSHDQTVMLAQELGLTPDELLNRPLGEAWNAEKITAARFMLAQARDELAPLAEKIKSKNATDEEKVQFRQIFSKYAAIQYQLHGIAAEAGRALNAFKIVAKSGELRTGEIDNILTQSGGDIDRLADGYLMLSDDPAKAARFVRNANKATGLDLILEYWINALLSSPKTHAVNILSNTLVAMMQVPERAMAAGWSKILKSGTEGVQAGEVGAQLFGMYRGSIDGLKAMYTVLKTGEPIDQQAKIEAKKYRAITGKNLQSVMNRNKNRLRKLVGKGLTPDELDALDGQPAGTVARFADFVGGVVRTPGRFLMAEDELFKSIGYRMELNALAYREGVKRGLKGEDLAGFIADTLDKPPESLHIQAFKAAEYQTFTSELGAAGKNLQKLVASAPIARFIIPFIRTPINILKYTTERMFPPLPFVDTKLKADLFSGDPARRDLALGKLSTGAMVWGTMSVFVAENYNCEEGDVCITGGYPADKDRRDALKRQGWQPYSIKFGDTWYSYSRLDPIGQMLGIIADSNNVMARFNSDDEDAMNEFSMSLLMAISNNMVNKTYLSGLASFLEAVESRDPEKFNRWFRRLEASFVPAAAGAVKQQVDPTWRNAQSVVDAWCAKLPGCSKSLEPVRDLWGYQQDTGYLGPDIVSPIMTSKEKQSPIDKELDRIEYSPKRIGKTLMGVEMSDEEKSYYEKLAGHALKMPRGKMLGDVNIGGLGLQEALNKVVRESKEYKKLSDYDEPMRGTKRRFISDVVKAYRQISQLMLLKKYPELMDNIIEQKYEDMIATGASERDARMNATRLKQQFKAKIREISTQVKIQEDKK